VAKRIGRDPFDELDGMIRAANEARRPPRESDRGAADTAAPGAAEAGAPGTERQRVPAAAASPACPHLGIGDDATTRFMVADPSHRCFAAGRAGPVGLEYQTALCLTAQYRSCELFVAALEAEKALTEEHESEGLLRRLSSWLWRKTR
jgi:hypothetical protein